MTTSGKWALVILYIIAIFVFTPYLPALIQFASSLWSSSGVSHFVLRAEIIIALGIFFLAIGLLIYGRKKAIFFLLSLGFIFLLSFIIYQFLPNPYEFTHLPEYAVLSALLMNAMGKKGGKSSAIKKNYLFSASMTGVIGIIDEIYQHFLPRRYCTIYDIFLNILGGVLGLLVFWGTRRQ